MAEIPAMGSDSNMAPKCSALLVPARTQSSLKRSGQYPSLQIRRPKPSMAVLCPVDGESRKTRVRAELYPREGREEAVRIMIGSAQMVPQLWAFPDATSYSSGNVGGVLEDLGRHRDVSGCEREFPVTVDSGPSSNRRLRASNKYRRPRKLWALGYRGY